MFVLTLLASLAATAVAQDQAISSQLPPCAQTCLSTAQSQQGGCSNVDLKCLCSNIAYINVLACCISTKCSSEDQQKAVAFNSQLCAGVNITIPNFIGCAATASAIAGATKTSKLPSSTPSGPSKTSSAFSASVLQKIGTAVTLPANPPVAQFTGGPLLQGSCSNPQFASVTVAGGDTLEYPWLGCSYENPGCCPFDIHIGGFLSVCPDDYATTGRACCPSGWSVYSTAFAGQTPCYTNPPTPLIPPTAAASATQGSSIMVINTKLFTLQFPLQPKKRGLSAGAKAGIAIGCIAGALLAFAIAFIFIRKRRQNALLQRNLSTNDPVGDHETAAAAAQPTTPFPFAGYKRNSIFSQNPHAPLGHISELLSPAPDHQPEMGFPRLSQSPLLPPITPLQNLEEPTHPPPPPPPVRVAPAEMPGSTYINEHHPAYVSGAVVSEEEEEGKGEGGGEGGGGFPSPLQPPLPPLPPRGTGTGIGTGIGEEDHPPVTPITPGGVISPPSETPPPLRIRSSANWGI